MKLHVLACNGHHQVSTPIKKNLNICVRECWWRDFYVRLCHEGKILLISWFLSTFVHL